MPTFEYRKGYQQSGIEAAVVYESLEKIREAQADEHLSPPDVVEAARPKKAPLHAAFEWDNGQAAEQYRLFQARRLIRSVYVVSDEATEPSTPAYVHIEPLNYQPVSLVVERIDLFEAALAEAHRKLASAERSVRELEQAAKGSGNPDRLATIALAVAAFETVREALAVLR